MKYLKLEIYVPEKNVIDIVEALNREKLIGDNLYDFVYTTTKVKGHFRPLEGAKPHIGSINEVEEIDEIKLETRVLKEEINRALKIIKKYHPYEVPVINIIELLEY